MAGDPWLRLDTEAERDAPSCGPDRTSSQIPPWLQQIRGPYTLQAGLAAYENHLGPGTGG